MATQTVNMSTYSARILAHTPNDASYFLRGDNTFTNILEHSTGTTEALFTLKDTATDIELSLKFDSNGLNHGIYSSGYYTPESGGGEGEIQEDLITLEPQWLIYRNANGFNTTPHLRLITGNSTNGGYIWFHGGSGYDANASTEYSSNFYFRSQTGYLRLEQDRGTNTDYEIMTFGAGTVGVKIYPTLTVSSRIYANEWVQFSNWTGIYSPNNNAHFYPNNVSTYGCWAMNGARGSYCGILIGNSSSYMNVMSSGEHSGLYMESKGRWIIYHQNSTNRIGIGGSTVSAGYTVQVNGSLYADSTSLSQLNIRAQGGAEGGEICLAASSSGYAAYLDIYQARFRVWATPGNRECLNVYLNTGTHSDYAEEVPADSNEPGHVYKEQNNGILTKANKRLISGCSIISDTHRMCIGNVDKNGVSVAVAGRVLVYPYQDRNNFQAGMAVCSAPNGTVDIMTREEIKEYPDCILGYVAGIPDPDTWPSENVPLKGRIWIRLA